MKFQIQNQIRVLTVLFTEKETEAQEGRVVGPESPAVPSCPFSGFLLTSGSAPQLLHLLCALGGCSVDML